MEHKTTLGTAPEMRAVSVSCCCGWAKITTYTRPGMGEVVAMRISLTQGRKHIEENEVAGT